MIVTTADTVAEARRIRDRERRRLAEHGVQGALSLTGGSSLEGLLTKGDIDLHLRVRAEDFETSAASLALLYTAVRREIWTATFATFERDCDPPVGIALTVVGSEHDRRFVASWERMGRDAAARARYNALKQHGGDVEDAKSRFFDSLVQPVSPPER
ncbi:hypothetical protein AAIB33_17435 [Microbacterium sp. AZCO]|uniref:hypothetical protein n=1 Tax=Microbacterium sp. AZCO TaxID=3142976 RepID=UPI0031F41F7B